jgi:pSer/pThr/pTyr-binding forkhead associated (FHA) protein
MEREIGIVCGRCESYSPLGATTCLSCANPLAIEPPHRTGTSAPPPTTRDPLHVLMAANGGATPIDPLNDTDELAAHAEDIDIDINITEAVPSDDLGGTSIPAEVASNGVQAAAHVDQHPSPRRSSGQLSAQLKSSKSRNLEELMDQAKNFVCRSCSTPVPVGHKFCGRCGAAVPPEIMNARTQFFGQLQAPGKAKLILIRGEGVEGLSYQLNADQHVVGKAGQLVFPDDPFVSPKHANFFYRNGMLCVRDEGSLNGVYLRVRGTIDISAGDQFLAGEQVFRFELPPALNDQPGPDGTYFYSSPKHQSLFRIAQVLQGGAYGMTVCARSTSLQIGREGGDLNFPTDPYMSASHCRIEDNQGNHTLTDVSSRNGTYLRLQSERELAHGDYLFIGRKLLRVEITAA